MTTAKPTSPVALPRGPAIVDRRVVLISAVAIALARGQPPRRARLVPRSGADGHHRRTKDAPRCGRRRRDGGHVRASVHARRRAGLDPRIDRHRRGARVPDEYQADFLGQVLVRDRASRAVVTLDADDRVDAVRVWLRERGPGTRHTGFPVLDAAGALVGVVTRTDVFDLALGADRTIASLVTRAPAVIHEGATARAAADQMVMEGVGRLVVVSSANEQRVEAIITRSDLIGAHKRRLDEASRVHTTMALPKIFRLRRRHDAPSASRH